MASPTEVNGLNAISGIGLNGNIDGLKIFQRSVRSDGRAGVANLIVGLYSLENYIKVPCSSVCRVKIALAAAFGFGAYAKASVTLPTGLAIRNMVC